MSILKAPSKNIDPPVKVPETAKKPERPKKWYESNYVIYGAIAAVVIIILIVTLK